MTVGFGGSCLGLVIITVLFVGYATPWEISQRSGGTFMDHRNGKDDN